MRSIVCRNCSKVMGVSGTDSDEPLYLDCWDCSTSEPKTAQDAPQPVVEKPS